MIFVWLTVTFCLSALSLGFAWYAMDNVTNQKSESKAQKNKIDELIEQLKSLKSDFSVKNIRVSILHDARFVDGGLMGAVVAKF